MYPFLRFKFSIPLLFTTNLKELKSKLKDMNRGMGIGKGKGRGSGNSNDRGKGLDKGELSSSFFLYYLFGILSTYFLSSHHKNL